MGLGANWKPEEIEKLKLYTEQHFSYSQIADLLGRSERAIQKKIDRTGLAKTKGRRRYKQWTKAELDCVAELIQEYPFPLFVKEYNYWARQNGYPQRLATSLSNKIAHLKNICRSLDSAYYLTLPQIESALGVPHSTLHNWLVRHKDILKPVCKKGGEKGWQAIARKDFRKFLLKYPELVERYRSSVDFVWLLDLIGGKK